MKTLLTTLMMLIVSSATSAQNINKFENEEDFGPGFFPHQKEVSQESFGHIQEESQTITMDKADFPIMRWKECEDDLTGNYYSYNCSNRREIAVNFHGYLQDDLFQCVDEGLKELGFADSQKVHIEHRGIKCDGNHNRRSLHCQFRALDIVNFQVNTVDDQSVKITYAKLGNRPFYEALRKCWGKLVVEGNECGVRGSLERTASIGWEDRNHNRHMHLSLPVCSNGRYIGGYFVK